MRSFTVDDDDAFIPNECVCVCIENSSESFIRVQQFCFFFLFHLSFIFSLYYFNVCILVDFALLRNMYGFTMRSNYM